MKHSNHATVQKSTPSKMLLPSMVLAQLLAFAPLAQAANSFTANVKEKSDSVEFSVKGWAADLRAAVQTRDIKSIASLLDISKIENKTLSHQMTPDRTAITKARAAFEKNQFQASVSLYDQVSKDSDFWLEAVEEKGWAYHRLEQYDKAMSQTKTLLAPVFSQVVGSEPFFLQSLSQLKVCDYRGILQTHKTFKETNRTRIQEMQRLADKGTSEAVERLFLNADIFPMNIKLVGNDNKVLPRLLFRDTQIQKDMMRVRMADHGQPVLNEMIEAGQSATLARKTLNTLNANRKISLGRIATRVKRLAQQETNENHKMLQKMNLIEVETIHRVHIDQGIDKEKYSKGQFAKTDADQLVFADDGQPWLDELDKYQYQVNACPKNIRRRM
jgi:hypothetical protein